MSEWQEYLLEDVIEKFIDYRGKTPTKTDSGIPLVTAKVVKSGTILPPNEFIAPEDYDSWMTRGLPEIGDVVLTTEAPLGEVALIKDKNVALAQRIITLRGNKKLLFNPFLKYYFQNETGQHELQSRASGTTVFGIKASVLKKVPISIPDLAEQKAIAILLSSLDDKIDLLHRQNKTLETMAETLFRQWFIEEAKEDWEDGKVEDLFVLQRGYDLPIQNRVDGKYPIFAASGFSGGHAEYKVTAPGVTTGRSGLIGKVFFIHDDFWPLNTSLYIKEFKRGTPLFSYFVLKNIDLQSFNAGSAVPTLNRNHVHESSISIPPDKLINEFERQMIPNFIKLRANEIQVRTLEKLRDTLLPKLMSGEVRVAI
jgi:type I restriction enzyme, S subunit